MTLTIEFLDEAREEAREATLWYARRSAHAAVGFSEALDLAVWHIEQTPDAWPPHIFNTRRLLLRRYPYHVIYRIGSDRIVVIAVAHTSRRPGYWRDRLADLD